MADKIKGSADVCAVRIVNHDSVLSDHGEYWGNYEEFGCRLAYEIMEKDDLALARVSYEAIDSHRRRIGLINLLRVCAVIAISVVAHYAEGSLGPVVRGILLWLSSVPPLDSIGWLLKWAADGPGVLLYAIDVAALGLLAYTLWNFVRILLAQFVYRPRLAEPAPARQN